MLRSRAELEQTARGVERVLQDVRQFAVERYCPVENPDDGENGPLVPVVWVSLPGRRNIENWCGPQCDGLHFRIVRAKAMGILGRYVCEHMGSLIE